MAVFVMYAAMLGLLYMILRSVFNIFYLLWRVIRFFIYPALFLVRFVITFGFRRRSRHPRRDWNRGAVFDAVRFDPDAVSYTPPSFAPR